MDWVPTVFVIFVCIFVVEAIVASCIGTWIPHRGFSYLHLDENRPIEKWVKYFGIVMAIAYVIFVILVYIGAICITLINSLSQWI